MPKIVEPTIFDLSSPGRTGVTMPASDVPETALPPEELLRSDLPLPELAEVDVVRHYMHLSSFNYSVDSGFYPLGSCTMKYNPKINEDTCRLPGFLYTHPLQPIETVQGNLVLMYHIAGMAERDRRLCGSDAAARRRRTRRIHRRADDARLSQVTRRHETHEDAHPRRPRMGQTPPRPA